MPPRNEQSSALTIDVNKSGQVLGIESVKNIQADLRVASDNSLGTSPLNNIHALGTQYIQDTRTNIVGRTAIPPPPPPIIDQPATIEDIESDLSYCEMLSGGYILLDSHFPQENKPIHFEDRLLHIIKQAAINSRFGNYEVLEDIRTEFRVEAEIDYTIIGDCKAAFDEALLQMYKDSSFLHLLEKN